MVQTLCIDTSLLQNLATVAELKINIWTWSSFYCIEMAMLLQNVNNFPIDNVQ